MNESNKAPFKSGLLWGFGLAVVALATGAILLARTDRDESRALPTQVEPGRDTGPAVAESDLPRLRRARERRADLRQGLRDGVPGAAVGEDAGVPDPALERAPYGRWRKQNEAALDAAGRVRALRQVQRNIDRLNDRLGQAEDTGHTERARLMKSRLKFLEERKIKLEQASSAEPPVEGTESDSEK